MDKKTQLLAKTQELLELLDRDLDIFFAIKDLEKESCGLKTLIAKKIDEAQGIVAKIR